MNCNEARALLATYRELKNGQMDAPELDAHLESCAACRQVLARQSFVGDSLRALPAPESATDAYTKLMMRLASEHTRLLQQSPSTTPPAPDFLKPFMRPQAPTIRGVAAHQHEALTAFSSAETGPLPILHIQKKRRRPAHFSQFTVIGIAAACLLVLMLSGLTSLVLISRSLPGNPSSGGISIVAQPQVKVENYATLTDYPNVVSAVATHQYIYYSGYGNNGWMLERLDTKTRVSTPLLSQASASPLVVLGSSDIWLVWLQLDKAKTAPRQSSGPDHTSEAPHTWTLNTLFLGATSGSLQTPAVGIGFREPIALLQGTFDPSTLPYWVHTPVQGIWFTQNALLVATVDQKGNSHLLQYQLNMAQASQSVEIASATNEHVLTSPTANSNGTSIFWSDEWMETDGLHSNIWTQQIVDDVNHKGSWEMHKVTAKYPVRSDGVSFNPQVIDNTLFLLSTNINDVTNSAQATPTGTAVTNPTPGGAVEASVTPRVATDPGTYIDESEVQGNIIAIALDSSPITQPTIPRTTSLASAPQGGSGFLFYQNDGGYGMYILLKGHVISVNVGQVPINVSFLAVNGNTAVWTLPLSNNAPVDSAGNTRVTFTMFHWPS